MNLNPNFSESWQIVKNNYKMFGLRSTLRNALLVLISNPPKDKFDKKWGTNTENHIGFSDLDFTEEQMEEGRAYSATPSRLVDNILKHLDFDLKEFSYVDMGSGLGRTLLLASLRPFKQVVGVELSEMLVSMCNKNIEAFYKKAKMKSKINIFNGDATAYQYPSGKVLVFMYDPFKAKLLEKCLDSMREQCKAEPGKEIYLVYVRSFHSLPVFEELEYLTLVKHFQVILLDFSWSLYKIDGK